MEFTSWAFRLVRFYSLAMRLIADYYSSRSFAALSVSQGI